MKISSTLDFAADPAAVAAMLTDRGFLEQVCAASDATEHSVEVAGATTTLRRTLVAPASAAKFTGETITVQEVVDWGEAAADGSRTGRLVLTVPGLPVTLQGTGRVAAGGKGTTVTYEGDLVVDIPFVGRKLEESAAPAVLGGIELQQRVGDAWLAAHA